MTLQQLRYVTAVADARTISKAAQKFYISQPSLTNSIHELEQELGLTIFHRTNRGVVLTPEGDVDVEALQPIYAAARAAAQRAGRPVACTLHRAFDVCRDPFAALEAARALGLSTILTSGQAPSAPEGAALLKRLVEAAGPELEILVGAGVTPENLPALAAATGARAYHLSGKRVLDSRMTFRREGVPMGLPGFSEFALWQTDAGVIRRARSALDSL